MTLAKLLKRTVLVGPIVGAMVAGAVLIGCSSGPGAGPDSDRAAVSQEMSERRDESSRGEHDRNGEQGREAGGEHGSQSQSAGEGGQHNEAAERSGESGDGDGGEARSVDALARDATFDEVRGGARLALKFDDASNSFRGVVENTSDRVLTRVRVEVHLDNGAELGPTPPTDLAPGETLEIVLPSTPEPFDSWTTHAEVGSGEGGSEHGAGGESGREGGSESREAEMSSPIIPLDQSWSGVLGGIAVEASFDRATGTAHTTVRNTLGETLCFVQSEPHLKSGTRTVGELGPDVIGDLAPGQEVTTSISVASEPGLAGVSFDGYVVHLEVFDCNGPGPQPHSSEGGESSETGEGRESSREHGSDGESGGEHGSGGEGGSHD
ncbi:MAG: hypothetical protein OXS30_13205 [Chloroflexota bacterium]|nr:hypothetical protein [Chloroflexota bacterium]